MKANRAHAFTRSSFALVFSLVVFQNLTPGRAQPAPDGQVAETFFNTISENDSGTFSRMLEASTNLVQSMYYGRLPLTVAAALGRTDMVAQLLRHGADINVQNDTLDTSNMRLTALEAAIEYGHPDTCQLLLQAGADPNVQSSFDGSALHYAFTYRQTEMAGRLLDYGGDPFLPKQNPYNQITPIEMAITQSDGKLVPRMLGLDPYHPLGVKSKRQIMPPRHRQTKVNTPADLLARLGPAWLAAAAQRGEIEAVQALLQAGVPARGNASANGSLLEAFAVAEASAARTDHFDAGRWWQIRDVLIRNGADYDVFAATAAGDVKQAGQLLASDKNLVQARDGDGRTPLHWAVQNNQPALITFWLQAGISAGATNLAGQTALHIAAANGLVEPVKLLLAAQAPVSLRDTNGWTPLDAAIQGRQTEAIHLLMAGQPAAAHPERGLALSIHQAAAAGNLAALAALLEATNQLEARNELGHTPLEEAVLHGHLAAAALLVDKGANTGVCDPEGNTLLVQILLMDRQLVVYDRPPTRWFERLGADPRKAVYIKYLTVGQYEQGPHPLLQAASFLLACGVDAGKANQAGQTPVSLLSGDKILRSVLLMDDQKAALLKLLAGGGGNLNAADADGNTALHLAGQDTSSDRAASLLASGADINATNHAGRTPLHMYAARIWGWDMNPDGTNEPFQLLVKSGANVNAQDNEGMTPLHVLALADTSFKKEAVHLLLAAGANPNLRDKHGRTPAHLFLSGKWPWTDASECVAMLARSGADLTARDDQGRTPLHDLASLGGTSQELLFFHDSIGDTFAAAKVDFNERDQAGNTPLLLAVKTRSSDVFEWLLKQGADLDATNNLGETPRLLAVHDSDSFGRMRPYSGTDIFEAIRENNLKDLTVLVNMDPKLVNQGRFGQTPLRLATSLHRAEMVEFLVGHGAR